MRLLAVDPGSSMIGFAYFEDESSVPQTAIMRAPAGPDTSPWSWLERVTWIAERIDDRAILWAPAVVAIETVMLGIPGRANPRTLETMAMTRGYLIRMFQEQYPGVEFMDVSPSTERRVLGLPFRVDRKLRQAAAQARWPGKTQEEADAATIGLAAFLLIREAQTAAVV